MQPRAQRPWRAGSEGLETVTKEARPAGRRQGPGLGLRRGAPVPGLRARLALLAAPVWPQGPAALAAAQGKAGRRSEPPGGGGKAARRREGGAAPVPSVPGVVGRRELPEGQRPPGLGLRGEDGAAWWGHAS